MKRREFLGALGGTAVVWPLAARAQRVAPPQRIGVLLVGLSPESKEAKQFRLGLRDAGYSEGRDVVIEWRSAKGNYGRVPELIADLIQKRVDVIVQDSTVGTEATMRSTSTIPIVMALVLDPVGSGLVKSLAHPGGNVTGLSMMATELYPKRLQLLKEVNPQLTRAAVLLESRPSIPRQGGRRTQGNCTIAVDRIEFRECAHARAVRFSLFGCHTSAGPSGVRSRGPHLLCSSNGSSRVSIGGPVTDHPRICHAGPKQSALISYGPDLQDLFRRAAIYVARIFRGAKPADLPVEQPTKFELVINLKTAKALSLTIPDKLLALTDDVIE